jgi:hypothetical protein
MNGSENASIFRNLALSLKKEVEDLPWQEKMTAQLEKYGRSGEWPDIQNTDGKLLFSVILHDVAAQEACCVGRSRFESIPSRQGPPCPLSRAGDA